MYKHYNTDEGVRRQRQIENCLLETMQIAPYSQITVGDICLKVGLSRKSFYRYFSNKEHCLHSLLDHCILEATVSCIADTPGDHSTTHAFERYFTCWKQMSPLLDALCQNQLATVLLERAMVCMTRSDMEFTSYFPANQANDFHEQLLFIVCGTLGLVINWHLSGYQKTVEEMAGILDRLLARTLSRTV